MINYDLCVAWNWEYDVDFVLLFEATMKKQGLSLLQVIPHNCETILESILNNHISFHSFWDRASDTDERFLPLVQWAGNHAVYRINPYEQASLARDKTNVHLTLTNTDLNIPYTIILPSYNEEQTLSPIDLSPLGNVFNIKPAKGGGGEGVIIEAKFWEQVLTARKQYPTSKYLLQTHIIPTMLDSRLAWFRVIYCAGHIYPCWWDIHTHIYAPVTEQEENNYQLKQLHSITSSIAQISGLDLFSTEIALTTEKVFVVVDYINEPIDLRLQSQAFDGVPINIVEDIINRLIVITTAYSHSSEANKNNYAIQPVVLMTS
ncbi:MAG: hypothetical protein V1872_11135 [bacterium]